jgi:hypothetical protein
MLATWLIVQPFDIAACIRRRVRTGSATPLKVSEQEGKIGRVPGRGRSSDQSSRRTHAQRLGCPQLTVNRAVSKTLTVDLLSTDTSNQAATPYVCGLVVSVYFLRLWPLVGRIGSMKMTTVGSLLGKRILPNWRAPGCHDRKHHVPIRSDHHGITRRRGRRIRLEHENAIGSGGDSGRHVELDRSVERCGTWCR